MQRNFIEPVDWITRGDAYRKENNYSLAEACYRKALRMLRGCVGVKHRLAGLKIKLAALYEAQSKALQSKKYLAEAIELLCQVKGSQHPVVLGLKAYLAGDKHPFYPGPLYGGFDGARAAEAG